MHQSTIILFPAAFSVFGSFVEQKWKKNESIKIFYSVLRNLDDYKPQFANYVMVGCWSHTHHIAILDGKITLLKGFSRSGKDALT